LLALFSVSISFLIFKKEDFLFCTVFGYYFFVVGRAMRLYLTQFFLFSSTFVFVCDSNLSTLSLSSSVGSRGERYGVGGCESATTREKRQACEREGRKEKTGKKPKKKRTLVEVSKTVKTVVILPKTEEREGKIQL